MLRARKAHGLTQAELAEKVDTSQAMISNIEKGPSDDPDDKGVGSSKFIIPICEVLSIPYPEHFEDENQRAWSQLGRVLRARGGNKFDLAKTLAEELANVEAEGGLEKAFEKLIIEGVKPKHS